MPVIETLGLSNRAGCAVNSDGTVSIRHPWGGQRLRGLSERSVATLFHLVENDTDSKQLFAEPAHREVAAVLARLPFLVVRTLHFDGIPVARFEPLGIDARPAETVELTGVRPRLSRFVLCRRHGDEFVLESPLSLYRVVLLRRDLTSVVAALAEGAAVGDDPVAQLLVAELAAVGMLETEDDPEAWEFHDLLFHNRSRRGLHDAPAAGTFRLSATQPHAPVTKEPMAAPVITLPDPSRYRPTPFSEVLDARRSIREYGPDGITDDQLGEFLYRALRVRHLDDAGEYLISSRPYPSAGAMYDLEVYLAVTRCRGLANGVYHYDPQHHVLRQLHDDGPELRSLVGAYAQPPLPTPDVHLVITSRLQRLAWKYESIAYSLALRNAGVLYQTLYLVATSMGLAPTGLGISDQAIVARVLGVPFTDEPVVGEFAIGSAP